VKDRLGPEMNKEWLDVKASPRTRDGQNDTSM